MWVRLSPCVGAGYLYNRGMAYRLTGRHADALRQFSEICDIYPLSVTAKLAANARKAALEETGRGMFVQEEENDFGGV